MTRILLINPPYTNFEGMAESAGHMMPLSLGYLASYARKCLKDLSFNILDAEALGLNYEGIKKEITYFAPDIVGITTPTPAVNHVYHISKIIKDYNKDTYVVLGGIHPTVMPERTLKEHSPFDFLVIGEGEESFVSLLKSIKDDLSEIKNVGGVYYRQNGKIFYNGKQNFINDLDLIPFPARDLYSLDLYRSAPTKKLSDENATPILTSRGCPYSCKHCPSEIIWARSIRYRSADNVIKEIEECVHKYNLKEFNFFDDTFTINKKRVIEVCNKLEDKKLDISWICNSRTNTIDDEMVVNMRNAGCKKISFGLESGNQQILNLMKKQTTVDMGRKAVKIVRKHRIPVHASFMLGNVGETENSVRETIHFAKNLGLDNATFFLTTPFPGTELYEIARQLGNITDDTAWERFAPLTNASPILVQSNLTKDQLIYWQKKAFRQFYLNPGYIIRKMKMLFSVNGISTLFEGLRVLLRILKK